MMTIYRLILVSLLTGGVFSSIDVIFKGMVLDFGAIAIPALLFILFSFIPPLHPYKTRFGMLFGLIFFSFFGLLYSIIYSLDLVVIKVLISRISGETIRKILEEPVTARLFRKNIPFFAMITGVTLLIWVWWIIIEWLYKTLGTISRADVKIVRLFWQSLTIFVFFIALIKTAEYTGNMSSEAINTDENLKEALAVNPVLALLFK